ncbi:GNAT family N-acetyltransferase [Nocardioides silvaticus]|uniref:GNAT family N-acetyltransferase n=1 Tax=Nocardioides silvaticus TaxID=2201891 RepID=A0A316TLP5_9ACTN|nr:GNAT family N-acetyltransferase [Nocardioides silvaticus]PWN03124.1 GNAT family N-acetyltransferase [Nocardioides silvaticus]
MAADSYEVSSDLTRMDLDRVHHWLSTDAYWSLGRSREVVEKAARGSLNFGAFTRDGEQVGYARVVTDGATFAWLCDVYVDRAHRGHQLGVRLVEAVVAELQPMSLKRVMLATGDAHELYKRFGFTPVPDPEILMIREQPGR